MARLFFRPTHPIVDFKIGSGLVTDIWRELFQTIVTAFNDLSDDVSDIGIHRGTLTELNALGLVVAAAGYLAFETTTGHLLRWTGSAWEFAPGDVGNGFFRDQAIAPQDSAFWQVCDGSVTSYLVLAATLSTAAFTTPNLVGTAAYRKSGTYTGTINAAAGSTTSVGDHVHTTPNTGGVATGSAIDVDTNLDGATDQVLPETFGDTHTHNSGGDTGSAGAHGHDVGTIDMAHLAVAVYFRR